MKLGVLSDSQGNIAGLEKALDLLYREGVKKIFFLGNNYNDIDYVIAKQQQAYANRRQDSDVTEFAQEYSQVLGQRPDQQLEQLQWVKKNIMRIAAATDRVAPNQQHLPLKEFEMVAGRIVCLVHHPKTLTKEDIASANLVFYGSSKLYQVDYTHDRYFLNPGHLGPDVYKTRPATYGILDINDTPAFMIKNLSGEVVQVFPLELEAKRKFSVS